MNELFTTENIVLMPVSCCNVNVFFNSSNVSMSLAMVANTEETLKMEDYCFLNECYK